MNHSGKSTFKHLGEERIANNKNDLDDISYFNLFN